MRSPRALLLVLAGLTALSLGSSVQTVQTFADPIDALSVRLPSTNATADVRYFAQGTWSEWETLSADNEQDPTLLESNLVMFPEAVKKIELRGAVQSAVHPIRISQETGHYTVAATNNVPKPRILSRNGWGADDSFLFRAGSSISSDETGEIGDNGELNGAPTQRQKDCHDAQVNYPDEFKTTNRTTKNADGQTYRWPLEYSSRVKLLSVHHTAMQVTGDARSGIERIRALYQYHANNRGWGDIGYHYLVDETGQIYEGKAGGPNVVGGHAYCNNVGTIGIALLGNFEKELPSQQQMKSLQWLLAWLGQTYDIDTDANAKVKFHGKSMPTIVGHRDLLSTSCPGQYAYAVLPQVRQHVAAGLLDASVSFPKLSTPVYTNNSNARKEKRLSTLPPEQARVFPKEGISPLGNTALRGRPGEQLLFSMRYQAGSTRANRGTKIAEVYRSAQGIGLWEEIGTSFERVSTNLTLPTLVPEAGSTLIRMKVQLPQAVGSYTMTIGPWTYQLEVAGRNGRRTPTQSQFQRAVTLSSSSRAALRPSTSSTSSARSVPSLPSLPSISASPSIRLRLTTHGAVRIGSDRLNETLCASPKRFDGNEQFVTITDEKGDRALRGIVECRIVDGVLMLINELPLEEYLWGLAEEPDTEPYEKQRAFAIAARTYAAYYMESSHRKFPGKSYDGSDSPAEFQAYKGLDFEKSHTQWVKAVKDTTGQVLTYNGQLIRPPYFSSDDGRTRSPLEAGWGNFPYAEIFASKPDPWCEGQTMRGHGVGMSGCGSEGQANEGKTAEQILQYYYPGTTITKY